MTDNLQVSILGLFVVLLGVVIVLVILRAVAWLVASLPMRRGRRNAFRRAGPVVAGLVGVAYALLAVRAVFHGTNFVSSLAVLAVIGVVLGLSWFALRDIVAGMFWKAGHVCQLGDVIRVEGVNGRVTRLGMRVLAMETEQGDNIFVPYSRLQHETLIVSREQFGESCHVFEVEFPTDHPGGDIERKVARMATLCHGTSLSRRPRVRQIATDRVEVTVFAIWSEPVPDLEFRIRRALNQPSCFSDSSNREAGRLTDSDHPPKR